MIYHITSRAAWRAAQARGYYRAASLASEGFIHCSRRSQVLGVANNFYRGQSELLLLSIDERKLEAALRWEAPAHPNVASAAEDASLDKYPHLYGRLNLDAVSAAVAFSESASGFALPKDLP